MLKEVIKIQFLNLLASGVNKGKKKNSYLIALIPLLAFLYVSCTYSYLFMMSLKGYEYIMLYLIALIAFSLVFMLSIQQAQGHLFGFKDYDLLLSLPINNRDIMISKIASFGLLQVLYMSFLFVPALLIYGGSINAGILYYTYALLGLIPFVAIPIVVSSGIGMLVKKLAGKSRFKNLFNNLIMIVIVFVIMLGSMRFSNMTANGADISAFTTMVEKIKLFLPSVYYYIDAILNGNIFSLIISLTINVGAFVIFVYIFAKSFISLNQDNNEGFHVKNYRLTNLKTSSIRITLFKKEFLRFIKNFMYVFNMAFSEVFLLGGSIYLLINKEMIVEMLGDFYPIFKNQMVGLVILGVLMISALSNTAGVSVSLEGKQLWITKSLPVKTIDILMSKVLVNVVVIFVPTAIAMLILKFALDLSVVELILCLIFALEIGFVVGLFGVNVNLNFPKLDYDREVLVIKQSMSTFIVVLGGMSISAIGGFIIFNCLMKYSAMLVVFFVVLILLVLIVLLYIYLVKVGIRKFEQL